VDAVPLRQCCDGAITRIFRIKSGQLADRHPRDLQHEWPSVMLVKALRSQHRLVRAYLEMALLVFGGANQDPLKNLGIPRNPLAIAFV